MALHAARRDPRRLASRRPPRAIDARRPRRGRRPRPASRRFGSCSSTASCSRRSPITDSAPAGVCSAPASVGRHGGAARRHDEAATGSARSTAVAGRERRGRSSSGWRRRGRTDPRRPRDRPGAETDGVSSAHSHRGRRRKPASRDRDLHRPRRRRPSPTRLTTHRGRRRRPCHGPPGADRGSRDGPRRPHGRSLSPPDRRCGPLGR